MASLAAAQELSRAYGDGGSAVRALASVTCSIAPAARIAVVGASGSGKSTLLHLLAGLDTPTSGSVSWPALGHRAELRPTLVGVVFQAPSLLPPLSVVENIELPLLLGHASPAVARAAASWALEQLRLSELADKLPHELSGGQAQRVAFARALAHRPRLILADEPTGQLDQQTAQLVFDVLLSALDGTDTALVVATHDLAVARRMRTVWRIQHGILAVDE
jgi:putative ABC transport system ATP-binding protein/lipoprotein-releasing system ATP-binding protein